MRNDRYTFPDANSKRWRGGGIPLFSSPRLAMICGLILISTATRSIASPLFATDSPISFFTNVASRLLSSELHLDLNRIQVYPTNQYTPSVHRLLQVTANIYDATTTNFYPSVFRPIFEHDVDGSVFIVGYTNLDSTNGPNTVVGPADPQLATPYDVSVLSSLSAADTPIADASGLVNVYGVPWIIGAKKYLPGLNQFSLVNAAQFTRRLQVVRNYVGGPIWTNQMLVMSITNNLGISFWNSYTGDYPTNYGGGLNMSVVVNSAVDLAVTNSDWIGPSSLISYNRNYVLPVARWPGSKWGAYGGGTPAANSFIASNWVNTVIPPAVYNFSTHTFDVTTNATYFWDTNRTILDPLPQFGLLTTNRVQAFIVDNTNVVDYVQLRGPINNGNLNSALNDPNYPDATGINYLWSTNVFGAGSATSWGIVNQMDISSFPIQAPPSAQWNNPGISIPGLSDPIAASRVFFGSILSPASMFSYRTDWGSIAIYTNYQLSVPAPFSATRTVYVPYLYQVNDPLVHYLASDLDAGPAGVWAGNNVHPNGIWSHLDYSGTAPFPIPPSTEIVKGRYQPWGKTAPTVFQNTSYNFGNAYNLIYKDPLVWGSDYWDFPTGQAWNLNWLGRVHRGTPWQTIYLKAHDVLHTLGAGVSPNPASGTNTWEAWTGDYNIQDAEWTCPVADRQLVSLLAAMLNTNDLHTQFSVNNPDPNAWAALFDGLTVLTNSAYMPPFASPIIIPAQFDLLSVSSNSPQAMAIADDIQMLSTNRPFHQIGEILAAPILTEQSPFLNWTNLNQQNYGISDEAYEAFPSQLLPLLREDSFGEIISSNRPMQVQFSGYDGYDYVVQASSNLVNWASIGTNSPVNGVFKFTIPQPENSSQQFYRSVLQ